MSLLHYDSPKYYNTALATARYTQFIGTSGLSVSPTAGRNGGPGFAMSAGPFNNTNAYIVLTLIPGDTKCILGGWRKFANFTNHPVALFQVRDAGDIQISLCLNTDGTLSVRRGNSETGVLLGTSSVSILTNTAYFIALKTLIHPSAGTYDIELAGVNILSGTGANTRATANTSWNQAVWCIAHPGSVSTINGSADELYCCDGVDATATQGAPNNDFLGDVSTQLVLPNADGGHSQFTPSAGGVHFSLVNENPPDGDTTYVKSATIGQRDTYVYDAVPVTGGGVIANMLIPYVRKDDAGLKKIADVVRIAGTDYDNAVDQVVTEDYAFYPFIRGLNPATGLPWTVSEINASERGLKITA